MNTTSILCPNCKINIRIVLEPPICSPLPIDHEFSQLYPREYSLNEILCVHEQLLNENKLLRKKIQELQEEIKTK